MMNLINEQIQAVIEDLELMTNPYERSMVRTHLIGALSNINLTASFDTMANSLPAGKDAIKNDIVKEPVEEPVSVDIEQDPIQADAPIVFEESTPVVEEEPKKKAEPTEVDVDPNTEEEVVAEPIVVQVEDEEGNVIDLDITEAWNAVAPSMQESGVEEEIILSLAQNLTAYNLMPIYSTFTELADSEDKMMLSYYMQQVGVEDINGFIANLSDGQFNDIYEFANNDNLEYIVTSIAEAMSEEE